MSARSEYEVGANVIVLLIEKGVIAPDRYNDHQLSIYTGVPRHELDRARKRLANDGPESLRPELPVKAAPSERGPRGPRTSADDVERARDLYVRIRRALPLRMIAAHFAATEGDDCIGEMCPACGHEIEVGQDVKIVGFTVHVDCEE